ncbi:MAG: alpha/beta hydrolase [Gammaproteobacteria bacterium]|nr:alpha/beta hydrolase [Gammaproteobacteria bacterium]MDH4256404.1 alpha/beta hydrolase [Gammaproteobacteria bacterium]
MLKPARAEEVSIAGPAGRLECMLEKPAAGHSQGCAIVCHPHPLHGGTMHNKVVHTLARAFIAQGLATLRFNFRGVSASEGSHDNGVGEVDDVLAAVDWMAGRYPGLPVWLGGFSFGGAMAIRAATCRDVAGLISVAPAAYRFAGDLAAQPSCPWLIVHGEADELVPVAETIEWVNSMEPGPELEVFAGTSHFFHGKLVELRNSVSDFVGRHS